MCFFDQTRWACRYWKWGTFRGQCPKEHRMGETCGLKLIYNTTELKTACKLCDQHAKKSRRLQKMRSDVLRWQCEGNRWATIEKTNADILEIQGQLDDLERVHHERVSSITM